MTLASCPQCGSSEVRHSNRGKGFDRLYALLDRYPFRCRKCRHRFFAKSHAPRAHKHEKKRGRRRLRPWMWQAALFALLLVIFYVFLRYLTHEPAPGPESRLFSAPSVSPW